QRGAAERHGRLRRNPRGHGSRQPPLRPGRAHQHARRLLRIDPAAHQGYEGRGRALQHSRAAAPARALHVALRPRGSDRHQGAVSVPQ
ncbi:unnamed protein product, partial [Ectocarpus sp. 12 AP-2014]